MVELASSKETPGLYRLAILLWGITPKAERLRLLWLLIAMFCVALLEVGSLVVIQQYLTFVTEGRIPPESAAASWVSATTLKGQTLVLSGGVIAVVLVKLLVGVMTNRALAITTTNNRINLATRLFRAYQFAPFSWHGTQNTSNLQRNLLQDTGQVSHSITLQFLQLLLNCIISLAVLGFVLLALPLELLGMIILTAGFLAFVGLRAQRVLIKAGHQSRMGVGLMLKVVREGLGALTEIRVLGAGDMFVSHFLRSQNQLGWAQKRQIFIRQTVPLLMENLILLALVMIIAYMALTADDVASAFAMASVLTIALFRLRQAMTKIVGAINAIGGASASLPPLVRDLEMLEPLIDQVPGPVAAPENGFSEFRLDDVSFNFPKHDTPAIKAMSLKLNRGEHLAIMGQTGAGKSTFLSLLLGLLKPTSGHITLNGKPLDQELAEWNAQIGYVPQSVFLLEDTIAANVAFGQPEKHRDPDRIRTALEQAQALDFVDALPDGLDSQVGEGGSALSGGQRQRIGIARALYRNPAVLVLDEATSALDRETQFRVMQAVSTLPNNPTVISVTHQLEPLEYADRLILLEAGTLAQDGPVAQVRQTETFLQITRTKDNEGEP